MDLLYFAKDKLDFIRRFYDTASQPFHEILRKIAEGEPPFEPPSYEGYEGEPAYVEEHVEAQDSLTVLGCVCLSLAQTMLMRYLDAWLRESGYTLPPPTSKKRKALLVRYYDFFAANGIDWDKGAVALHRLEDITMTRNAIQHEMDLMTMYTDRTEDQRTKHPDSPFQDRYGFNYVEVTKDVLFDACRDIEVFCEFLENKRR